MVPCNYKGRLMLIDIPLESVELRINSKVYVNGKTETNETTMDIACLNEAVRSTEEYIERLMKKAFIDGMTAAQENRLKHYDADIEYSLRQPYDPVLGCWKETSR